LWLAALFADRVPVIYLSVEPPPSELVGSRSYLANLPGSELAAKELLAWGEENLVELGTAERFPLATVRLLEPTEVAALFDFGLTPRHLANSAGTMLKYEKDDRRRRPCCRPSPKQCWRNRPPAPPASRSTCPTTRAT
jgi:hypothetical protein